MSDPVHISETRHGRMLAEAAGMALSLAREAHERAMAAETDEAFTKHAATFNRATRSMRQSLALEARLGREQEAHDLQHAPLREKDRKARVSKRYTEVFQAVKGLIWDEAGGDCEQYDFMVDDLGALLNEESREDAFLDEPVDQQIVRIAARFELGLGEDDEEDPPTSPNAAALAGGGPSAEEPMVEGAGPAHGSAHGPVLDPPTMGSPLRSAHGPPSP